MRDRSWNHATWNQFVMTSVKTTAFISPELLVRLAVSTYSLSHPYLLYIYIYVVFYRCKVYRMSTISSFTRQNKKKNVRTITEFLCSSTIRLHERKSILNRADVSTLIMTIPESLIYDLFIFARHLTRISILIYVGLSHYPRVF